MTRTLIFSTSSYNKLAQEIVNEAQTNTYQNNCCEIGLIEEKIFPDGEIYHRVLSEVENTHVVIVSGTVSDKETMELFDLANTLVDAGALRLSIILPYFGYATMERSVKKGEAVKAKYRARLLSSLPRSPLGNHIYMLDLHSEGIPHYFENGLQTTHIYAKPVVMRAAQELAFELTEKSHFVLASTDAGRMKWIESLAKDMGVEPAFAYKKRIDGSNTVSLGISGPVKNSLVIIYDDMIRTGSSLISAGQAYKDAGALKLAVVSTHGIFPNNSLAKIQNTGLFEKIVVTNSYPFVEKNVEKLESNFLKIESIAELFVNVFGL